MEPTCNARGRGFEPTCGQFWWKNYNIQPASVLDALALQVEVGLPVNSIFSLRFGLAQHEQQLLVLFIYCFSLNLNGLWALACSFFISFYLIALFVFDWVVAHISFYSISFCSIWKLASGSQVGPTNPFFNSIYKRYCGTKIQFHMLPHLDIHKAWPIDFCYYV